MLVATVIDIRCQLDQQPSAAMVKTVARYALKPFMADTIVARP